MEVDALKKLLGDLKGVVAVATAQAWEWRTLQGEMKPCPSYALSLSLGWLGSPSFLGLGRSKACFCGWWNFLYCAFEVKIQSQRDEGFVAESILKHKSLEGKPEVRLVGITLPMEPSGKHS